MSDFQRLTFQFRNFCQFFEGIGFGFGKFGIGKKSRYRFRKIWYQKKSLGIVFGQNFGIVIQCPGDILIISIIKIIIIMYLIIQKENQETKTIMVVGM